MEHYAEPFVEVSILKDHQIPKVLQNLKLLIQKVRQILNWLWLRQVVERYVELGFVEVEMILKARSQIQNWL